MWCQLVDSKWNNVDKRDEHQNPHKEQWDRGNMSVVHDKKYRKSKYRKQQRVKDIQPVILVWAKKSKHQGCYDRTQDYYHPNVVSGDSYFNKNHNPEYEVETSKITKVTCTICPIFKPALECICECMQGVSPYSATAKAFLESFCGVKKENQQRCNCENAEYNNSQNSKRKMLSTKQNFGSVIVNHGWTSIFATGII